MGLPQFIHGFLAVLNLLGLFGRLNVLHLHTITVQATALMPSRANMIPHWNSHEAGRHTRPSHFSQFALWHMRVSQGMWFIGSGGLRRDADRAVDSDDVWAYERI